MKGINLTFSVYRTITRSRTSLSRSLAPHHVASHSVWRDRSYGTDHLHDNNGDSSPPQAWPEGGGKKKAEPQIHMTVTRSNLLKMSIANSSGEGPTQFTHMYQNIDFSGLEARLQSEPRGMRWVPRFIRKRFYPVLMAQAKRKLLAEDFNEDEFYHYGALVSMSEANVWCGTVCMCVWGACRNYMQIYGSHFGCLAYTHLLTHVYPTHGNQLRVTYCDGCSSCMCLQLSSMTVP